MMLKHFVKKVTTKEFYKILCLDILSEVICERYTLRFFFFFGAVCLIALP
jgi:hypothetical protein